MNETMLRNRLVASETYHDEVIAAQDKYIRVLIQLLDKPLTNTATAVDSTQG